MWTCPQCRERHADSVECCWNCGTLKGTPESGLQQAVWSGDPFWEQPSKPQQGQKSRTPPSTSQADDQPEDTAEFRDKRWLYLIFLVLMCGVGAAFIPWIGGSEPGAYVCAAFSGILVGTVIWLLTLSSFRSSHQAWQWAKRQEAAGADVATVISGTLVRTKGVTLFWAVWNAVCMGSVGGIFGIIGGIAIGSRTAEVLLAIVGALLGAGAGAILGAAHAVKRTTQLVIAESLQRRFVSGQPHRAAVLGAIWGGLLGAIAGATIGRTLWPHLQVPLAVTGAILAAIVVGAYEWEKTRKRP